MSVSDSVSLADRLRGVMPHYDYEARAMCREAADLLDAQATRITELEDMLQRVVDKAIGTDDDLLPLMLLARRVLYQGDTACRGSGLGPAALIVNEAEK